MGGSLGLLYSAMIALYKLNKDSNLYPEIVSLFKDEDALKMFFLMLGGETVRIPTIEEFYKALKVTYYAYLSYVEKWSDERIVEKEGFSKEELAELKKLAKEARMYDELVIRNPLAKDS